MLGTPAATAEWRRGFVAGVEAAAQFPDSPLPPDINRQSPAYSLGYKTGFLHADLNVPRTSGSIQ